MSYKLYIKEDYKPVIRWVEDIPWYGRSRFWAAAALTLLALGSLYLSRAGGYPEPRTAEVIPKIHVPDTMLPSPAPSEPPTLQEQAGPANIMMNQPEVSPPPEVAWDTVTVRSGDSLSLIFNRAGLSPAVLYQVMQAGKDTALLKRLLPGQEIRLQVTDSGLQALQYEPDLTTLLEINRSEDGFHSTVSIAELETRIRDVSTVIEDSLFLAGQDIGLSDNLIMRCVAIYGWDIDFALDIRSGDRFRLIFEELYKDGAKVREGNILAAEFINRNRPHRAVRYTTPEGETGYFNDEGYSMRKAFLRTPVKFSRISSGFSLHRKHPVLNTIRAHRGVDYAAPTGTPVKATGDGIVVFAGVNGGLGRTITIRHGGVYQTVYAHLSRLAKGIQTGRHVEQGNIIGYVGMSGLATGPHLHYEFRVNGVHQNPLQVELPKALKLSPELMVDFRSRTAPLLAQLDASPPENVVIALSESDTSDTSVH